MVTPQELVLAALEARSFAYTPYSGYSVGAALLTKSGSVYTGCNIESAAFSPTNCAERTAVFKAVSEGEREFDAIAIIGGRAEETGRVAEFASPCGVCRQVLREFDDGGMTVILARSADDFKAYRLEELLPFSFSQENL